MASQESSGALGRHDEVAAVILERAAVEGLGVREAAVYMIHSSFIVTEVYFFYIR